MNGLIMAAQLIAGLSILVTLHELGHYWAARAFGIKVEKFFLFFDAWGYKLLSVKVGETEYGIGWLPLGGYVKIAGMIDESMDTEQMKLPAESWEFRSKPAWQRLIVMIAGVVVNLILGIVIFWLISFKIGDSNIPNSEAKNGIVAMELAKEIGLQSGDKITAINGKPLVYFDDIMSSDVLLGGATISVLRNEKPMDISVPKDFANKIAEKKLDAFISPMPRIIAQIDSVMKGSGAEKAGLMPNDRIIALNDTAAIYQDEVKAILIANAGKTIPAKILRGTDTLAINVAVSPEGALGFYPKVNFKIETQNYNIAQALPVGTKRAFQLLSDQTKGFGKLLTGDIDPTKSLEGPIGIATKFGSTFEWLKFWTLTGILSLILAFMNILPIPALDGGHTVFLIIEMIKGKPLSDKFMERAQTVGFVILLALMIFAFGNDILKYIIN